MPYSFNTGRLWALASGSSPVEFGLLQDISLDFGSSTKELRGQNRFPEVVALTDGKIDGKASSAEFNANALNMMLAGMGTLSVGQKLLTTESFTLDSSHLETVSHSTGFFQDLGVMDVSNPLLAVPMKQVASNPTTGQYSVSAGVYTFASGDSGKAIQISYIYTDATTGQTITLTNQPAGVATSFAAYLSGFLVSKDNVKRQVNVWLNACISSKLSLAFKTGDFNIPQFDFSAFSDAAGNIGWMSIGS